MQIRIQDPPWKKKIRIQAPNILQDLLIFDEWKMKNVQTFFAYFLAETW